MKLSYLGSKDFGEYWSVVGDMFHSKFYPRLYTEQLKEFLRSINAKNIIDVACGAGFPSIHLLRDFTITCSDGDASMLAAYKRRLRDEGMEHTLYQTNWLNLAQQFANETFDTVLCLDSSITYVDTWANENKINVVQAKHDIKESLKAFYNLLQPGGTLVVGLAKHSFDSTSETVITYDPIVIEGVLVEHEWHITYDPETKIKIWRLITKYNNQTHIREFQSYMLSPEELYEMLHTIGFTKVEVREIMPGEYDNNYVCTK